MIFDLTLQTLDMEVSADGEQVTVALMVALPMPISANQAIAIPLGVVRAPMTKEEALARAQAMMDAANELPDEQPKSDLIIAQNMAGVEKAAQSAEKMKGK